MGGLEYVVNVLLGREAPPPSRFLSFTGPLAPQQVSLLCSALKNSPYGGGLRLKGCELGDEGAKKLAEALSLTAQLESLELQDNGIGPSGAEAMAAALALNSSILDLDLSGNPCEVEAPQALHRVTSALRRNRLSSQGGGGTPGPAGTPPGTGPPTPQLFFTPGSTRPARPPPLQHGLRKSVCIQEMPPETPSGLAYRMRQELSQSVSWEVCGPLGALAKENVSPTSLLNPVDVEYRLQAVEDSQGAMADDLERLKGLGGHLSAWRGQMEEASAQVAAVLCMVEGESGSFRSELASVKEELRLVREQQQQQQQQQQQLALCQPSWADEQGLAARVAELEAGSARHDAGLQSARSRVAEWMRGMNAAVVELQVCMSEQAERIAGLQASMEQQQQGHMRQAARIACLEATLQQLQASAQHQQAASATLRQHGSKRRRAHTSWPISMFLLPLARAARWMLG